MKPQIEIDGVTVTVWRHLSRQRATGYDVKHHDSQPGMRGGHFVPRRLAPSGISLEIKSQQSGLELWTEAEKLEVWTAEPLALEDIAVIDTTAKCITTKTHASVAAEVTRMPLTETEYQTVLQERLIATMSQQRDTQIVGHSRKVLRINSKIEQVWRCESPVTFHRVRYADLGTPDRIERTVHGKTSYYLEVFLTGRVLVCWTDSPVEASTVSGIDTTAQTILLTTGDSVPCRITDRKPTDKEQEFIQQERLIESNNAMAGGLGALSQKPAKPSQEPLSPPEVNETILWHVQQRILDELDTKLKSAPSAGLVFTLYCRDRMTLAAMSKRHGWPYRTLKARKATLEAFLNDHFDLTLAAFFIDRSIFGAAERQLQDRRAKHISPHALVDGDHVEGEA